MLVVGLTGGIGSGKSTVSGMLERHGAEVIDADAITRQLQQPGMAVFEAMVDRFGPEIVAADGTLDRDRVASIVFHDPAALSDLNAIVHPAVGEEIARRLAEERATDAVVVLDVPLLVETGRGGLAGVIVVDLPPEEAVRRLVESRGFDEGEAWARIERQAPRHERLASADFVIDNSGELDALAAEVDRCWQWIEELRAAQAG